MGAAGRNHLKIFISAGEASGDLHGSSLCRAIKGLEPHAEITCLGGSLLKEAGAEVLVDNARVAVVGLSEVFRHAADLYRAWLRIKSHIVRERPDLVVLIDFPDFNFLLARIARKAGSKVFYYISPQLWAWRSGRVGTLKRLVDGMAVILPFEPAFYARFGMKTSYVGHPLLDVMKSVPSREEALQRYVKDHRGPVVGLLPGSRRSELRLLFPLLLETAAILKRKIPDISFLIPVAPTLRREALEAGIVDRGLPIRIISGDTYGVIRACDLIVAASGTVTLEAAILGTPMIIFNRLSNLSYQIGRRLVKVRHIGLPNLIAGRTIAPELIQSDARAEKLASLAKEFINRPELLEEQRRELAAVQSRLGAPGVAERVARLVLDAAR